MPIGTSLNQSLQERTGEYTPTGASYARKNVTFSNVGAGEIVIGVLPPNAAVLPGVSGVWVKTLFNGTTPVINIGVAGTPAMFGSALALGAAIFVPVDDAALAAAVPTNAYRNLVVTLTGTTVTAGSADVIVAIAGG